MHLATLPDGSAQYCCLSKDAAIVAGERGNLGRHSVDQLINSPAFCGARKKMLTGEMVPSCSTCYKEEQTGGSSQRITHTEMWLNKFPELLDRVTSADDFTISPNVKYLDLRFGNLCNLKCRSCSPLNSSQLMKEASELAAIAGPVKEFSCFTVYPELLHINDWYQTDMFEKNLGECYNTVDTVYFTGGEPTLIEQNYDIMENLVTQGRAQTVSLTFNSNMTNVQPRFCDLIRQFKSVRINASIDGYGPVQEYLRYPSKWSIIDKNLRILAEFPNIQLCVTAVVQVVNLENITELFQYIEDINSQFNAYRIEVLPIVLDSPHYLDFVNLPPAYKEMCIRKIDSWIKQSRYIKFDHYAMSRIDHIRSKCTEKVLPHISHQWLTKFKKFTQILDGHRNQQLYIVNPDLVETLAEYK